MVVKERLIDPLKTIVNALINRKFVELEKDGRIGRLTSKEIAWALDGYPGTLSAPPDQAFADVEVYPVRGREIPEYQVEFDLWYDGKRSDLTLLLTAIESPDGLHLSIDDLRAL